jgi:hypothetical protein
MGSCFWSSCPRVSKHLSSAWLSLIFGLSDLTRSLVYSVHSISSCSIVATTGFQTLDSFEGVDRVCDRKDDLLFSQLMRLSLTVIYFFGLVSLAIVRVIIPMATVCVIIPMATVRVIIPIATVRVIIPMATVRVINFRWRPFA